MQEQVEDIPAVGSVWKHKKGTLYVVLVVANTQSDRKDEFPTTVVYQGEDGKVWSRPLYRWHGSMALVKNRDDYTGTCGMGEHCVCGGYIPIVRVCCPNWVLNK